jgi:hypothetical protein
MSRIDEWVGSEAGQTSGKKKFQEIVVITVVITKEQEIGCVQFWGRKRRQTLLGLLLRPF